MDFHLGRYTEKTLVFHNQRHHSDETVHYNIAHEKSYLEPTLFTDIRATPLTMWNPTIERLTGITCATDITPVYNLLYARVLAERPEEAKIMLN